MSDSKFIVINLNKAESKESKTERWKDRSRWLVFGVLVLLLLGANGVAFYVYMGYNELIDNYLNKRVQIEEQIEQLQSKGKNLSKSDIIRLAKLEEGRMLWARNLELLGAMTADDMAITGLDYRYGKLRIEGIAVIYENEKEFDIINNYIVKLQSNEEFARNFGRIKFLKSSRRNVRAQEILMFEIEAPANPGVRDIPDSEGVTS